jgi:hypothetical protein
MIIFAAWFRRRLVPNVYGEVHSIIDKVSMSTGAAPWLDFECQRPGFMGCAFLNDYRFRAGISYASPSNHYFKWTDERSESG